MLKLLEKKLLEILSIRCYCAICLIIIDIKEKMKITIIYDNETLNKDLVADWGFACLVEAQGRTILFDTGAKGNILLENMKSLNIDPRSIEIIVISHAHWDHTDGLADFLKENNRVSLYIPSSYSVPSDAASEIIVVKEPIEICEGVFSTGELKGDEKSLYGDEPEQSLIVDTDKGNVVIAGCSHPGVRNILEAASSYGKVYALVGGLHDFSEFDLLKGIEIVCATHCTEYKAEIKTLYPETYTGGGAGVILEI